MAVKNRTLAAAMVAAPSLSDQEFLVLMARFAPFEDRPVIAVALSGGIDSMALALLAHQWVQPLQGKIIALTVDHGLRAESASEAEHVKALCETKGIEHHILRWQPPALSSAIQHQARDARYSLLADWCKKHQVLHLMTAHHLEDQTETLFFRLARGSGLSGLAAMACVTYSHELRLLRPLLATPKARLQATLTAAGQPWVEDPSNQSLAYSRNLIRSHMAKSDSSSQASGMAARLGAIRNHMEKAQASYATDSITIYPEGTATLDISRFRQVPQEYGLRLLTALIQTLSGDEYSARSNKLERLYNDLCTEPAARTLAGLQFTPLPDEKVFIYREPKAAEQPLSLEAGKSTLWDKRFYASHTHPTPLQVSYLGTAGARIIKDLQPRLPWIPERHALSVLPAFWDLEQLVAVPHIHYQHPAYGNGNYQMHFAPAKSLAASAFSGMNI